MIVRSTFFKLVITGILICGIVVVILNFMSYNGNLNNFEFGDDNNVYIMSNKDGDALIRIKADVKSNSKPASVEMKDGKSDIPEVRVRTYMIPMNHEHDQNILVREAGEGTFTILLLHGQSFSSITWEKLGTLQYLASWGYRAFAIDLPGYGNSSLPVIQETAAGQWLTRLIRALRLSNFVIISPSMSGRFAVPFIIQSNSKLQSLRGFVPIAPVGTKSFDKNDYKQITIPTLIVHGENDTKFQSVVETLKQIPSSEVLMIKNASHACYVQQPIDFHNGLRQFLYKVYRPIYIEQYKTRLSTLTDTSALSPSINLEKPNLNTKERNEEEEKIVNNTSSSNKNQQHLH